VKNGGIVVEVELVDVVVLVVGCGVVVVVGIVFSNVYCCQT